MTDIVTTNRIMESVEQVGLKLDDITLDSLDVCESAIEAAQMAVQTTAKHSFRLIGRALESIRKLRLYKSEYSSFDTYLSERWNFTRQYASKVIQAANKEKELSKLVDGFTAHFTALDAIRKFPVKEQPKIAKAAKKLAAKAGRSTVKAKDVKKAAWRTIGKVALADVQEWREDHSVLLDKLSDCCEQVIAAMRANPPKAISSLRTACQSVLDRLVNINQLGVGEQQ